MKRPSFYDVICRKLPPNAIRLYTHYNKYDNFVKWLDDNNMQDVQVFAREYKGNLRWVRYCLYYIECDNEALSFFKLKYNSLDEAYENFKN